MFALIFSVLLGTCFPDVLDPSLTEWKQLKTDFERVIFPLRDYVLEVKSYLPDEYDTNPPYAELIKTNKVTTMMLLLYSNSWNNRVGRLVWNTIKYDRGFDVAIGECNARYQAYESFPADKRREQIWAWNFMQDHVELRCDGKLQFSQHFDESDKDPRKPWLSEKCRQLGDADIDRIVFKHMAGEFIRGKPKSDYMMTTPLPALNDPTTEKTTTEEQTTTQPTTSSPGLAALSTYERYPTCDCWTSDCNFCSNLQCAVKLKRGVDKSDFGVQVLSKLGWRRISTIVLYNKNGEKLGYFRWSLRLIFLTECLSCQSPPAIRRIRPGSKTLWDFSLKDGVVQIKIGDKILYRYKLRGKCARRYEEIGWFSFSDMSCDSRFGFSRDRMVTSMKMSSRCSATCPKNDKKFFVW